MIDHVNAKNSYVGSILRKIVSIAVEAGAELHPSLLIVEKDGELSLHSSMPLNVKDHAQLCRLPRVLLLPTNGADWQICSEQLFLKRSPDCLSLIQEELLRLHVEIYNATCKIKNSSKHNLSQLVLERPEILEAVQQIQPYRTFDLSLADQFVSNRLCWIDDVSISAEHAEQANNSDSGEPGIFPIMDFLNNHHDAGDFEFDDCSVKMEISRPNNTSECFLRYGGRRDVLDYALGMGYFDQTSPYAHSAPFSAELNHLGALQIESLLSRPKSRFDPPRVQFTDDGIQLSHFTCHLKKPKRSLLAFSLAIEGLSRRSGGTPSEAKELILLAKDALLQENLIRLEKLRSAANPYAIHCPSAQLLMDAARRQANILQVVLGSSSRKKY